MYLTLRNKILLLILFVSSALLFAQLVLPIDRPQVAVKQEVKPNIPEISAKQFDPRAKILADYLEKRNSPMKNQAQDFIDAADHYGIDWKLVPAIAGVES